MRKYIIPAAVLLAVLLLPLAYIAYLTNADNQISVESLQVTNLTDSAFTLVWQSNSPYLGEVVFSEGTASWPILFAQAGKSYAQDDRNVELNQSGEYMKLAGEQKQRYSHHVTIRDLKPDTDYNFRVGGRINGKSGSVVSSKTLTLRDSIATPDPAYGKIENLDATDSIVLARKTEGEGIFSTTVSPNGTYSIDMGTIFPTAASALKLNLEVWNQNNSTKDIRFDVETYKPLQTIRFKTEGSLGQSLVGSASAQAPIARGAVAVQYVPLVSGCNVLCRDGRTETKIGDTCIDPLGSQGINTETERTFEGVLTSVVYPAANRINFDCNSDSFRLTTEMFWAHQVCEPTWSSGSYIALIKAICRPVPRAQSLPYELAPEPTQEPTIESTSSQPSYFPTSVPTTTSTTVTDPLPPAVTCHRLSANDPKVCTNITITPEPCIVRMNGVIQLGTVDCNTNPTMDPAINCQIDQNTWYCNDRNCEKDDGLNCSSSEPTTTPEPTPRTRLVIRQYSQLTNGVCLAINPTVMARDNPTRVAAESRCVANRIIGQVCTGDDTTERDSIFFLEAVNTTADMVTACRGYLRSINPQSNIVNPQSSQVLGASDEEGLRITENGRYGLFSGEARLGELDLVVDGGVANVKLFEDKNGNQQKDADESYIADYSQIKFNKESSLESYRLNSGWNLIHIPLIDDSGSLDNASELITEWNKQGVDLKHVARFAGGKFELFTAREDGQSYAGAAGDFKLIPGQALFVLNVGNSTSVNYRGNKVESGIKIKVANGWNLVGIASETDYTSESFFKKLTDQSVQANTISEFENGVYESVIVDAGTVYGNNFNMIGKRGYFVRVESGGGKDFVP